MLAQVDPTTLHGFLGAGFFILGGLASLIGIAVGVRSLFRPTPQPLEVAAAPRYASASDHEQLRQELRALQKEFRTAFDALSRDREESAEKLHTRINDIAAAVGEVNGKLTVLLDQR